MDSNLSYLDLHSIMAAASSEKVGEDRSGVSGVLSPSEVREASLDLNSEISCRSEARASLDGGPPRFIRLADGVLVVRKHGKVKVKPPP